MIAAEETPVIERDECPRDVSVFETEVMEEEREAPDPPRPPGMMENGKFDCDSSDENSAPTYLLLGYRSPPLRIQSSSSADRRLRPLRMGYRSRPLRIQSSSSESEESVDDRMHPPNCACQQGPSNGWRWSWNLGGYWDHYKIEAPDPPPGRPSGSTAARCRSGTLSPHRNGFFPPPSPTTAHAQPTGSAADVQKSEINWDPPTEHSGTLTGHTEGHPNHTTLPSMASVTSLNPWATPDNPWACRPSPPQQPSQATHSAPNSSSSHIPSSSFAFIPIAPVDTFLVGPRQREVRPPSTLFRF